MRRVGLEQAVTLSELAQAQRRVRELEEEKATLLERIEALETALGKAPPRAVIVMPKDRQPWGAAAE